MTPASGKTSRSRRRKVEAEIDRTAQRFGVPTDQLLKLLEEERGIQARQYAMDIIWPTLALQKLAAPKLVVTEKELFEAHETQYGEAIKARMIACKTREKAEELRATAVKNPDSFGDLAMEHSIDPSSGSTRVSSNRFASIWATPRWNERLFRCRTEKSPGLSRLATSLCSSSAKDAILPAMYRWPASRSC